MGDGGNGGDGGDALVVVKYLGELLFEGLFLLHDALHIFEQRRLVVDEMRAEIAGDEARVGHDGLVERNVGLDAHDDVLVKGAFHARDGLGAVPSPDDQLGDHGVVHIRNGIARVHAGVHPDARAARRTVAAQLAGGRGEVGQRVFGIDAALDGPAVELDVLLLERERLPLGDAYLLLDDVDAGHHLGHRMLHLHARVGLHEVKLAVREDELHRAGALVAHPSAGLDGYLAHLAPQLRSDGRRRAFLDELLVAPLDGALALPQVDHVARLSPII